MNVGSIEYYIDANTRGLLRAERDVSRSTGRMEKQFNTVDKSTNQLSNSLNRLSGVAAAVISAIAIRQLVAYADAFTNVQNRLKVVTDSSEQLADVTNKVANIARESRSNLESTAVLYSRLARSTEELNIGQARLLGVTETITKSFTLSGATATEASNAIRQLSQGFAAGALRGEEFNSVAEQAPEILRAVAIETGMNVGALREFAAEGGITSELLISAIENYADTVEEEFQKTQATFSQSLEVSRTNVIQFVGELESGAGVVGLMGDALVRLSQNLRLISELGAAIALLYGSRVAGAFITSAAAKVKDTAATLASAKATQTQAAAAAAATAAEVALLRSVQAGLVAQLQSTTNTALQAQLRTRLAANTAALVVANNALTASQIRANTAMVAGSVAARGVSGALALVGGPVGAAVIAAVGIGLLTKRYIDNTAASDARNQKLAEEIRLNGIAKNAQDAYNKSVDAAFEPVKRYADAQKEAFANEMQGASQAKFQEEIDFTSKALKRAEATLARYNETQSVSAARLQMAQDMVKKYSDRLDVLTDLVPTLTTSEEKAAEALAKVTESIGDQLLKIREGEQAYDIMLAQRKAGVTAMSEEGKAIADLIRLRDQEQAQLDAQNEKRKDIENERKQAIEDQKRAAEQRQNQLQTVGGGDLGLTDTQALDQQYEAQRQSLLDAQAAGIQSKISYEERLTELQREYSAERQRIMEEEQRKQNTILGEGGQEVLSAIGSAFGAFAEIAKQGGRESFQTYKNLASAQAAIAASLAVIKALAEGGPIAGPILAGSIAALAGAQVAAIQNQQYSGGSGRLYGGATAPGNLYPITEDGRPEILTEGNKQYLLPGSRGNVTSNRDMMGMGGATVNIDIINNAAGMVNVTPSSSERNGQTDIRFVIDAVSNDIMEGGKVYNSIKRTTNAGTKTG